MLRTGTVYERVHAHERMNDAAVEIQQIIFSKRLTITEAIVVLDVVRHNWMHELIETDERSTKVLFELEKGD